MAMRWTKWLGFFLILALGIGPGFAQSPVVTQPSSQAATNFSNTISVTNTFQSVFAASAKRQGCSIQNNGSNTMWVYFGDVTGATKAKSFILAPTQSILCGSLGVVAKDQVSITGTATDAFAATQDGSPTIGAGGGGTITGTVTANQGTAGTNAQAWWVRIGDATNGPAAVKAASTAAVATDPALVMAISPNGQLSAGSAISANSVPVVIASDQSAVAVKTSDPCTSTAKSSAAISVATATTTSLVAVSGSTTVYVCGFSMTIAPSAVTAATALFEYGTGASCTSPTSLTGTFGNGDLTSAAGVAPVLYGNGAGTVFKSAASAGICILTAGNAVSVQGVLTYVQQ